MRIEEMRKRISVIVLGIIIAIPTIVTIIHHPLSITGIIICIFLWKVKGKLNDSKATWIEAILFCWGITIFIVNNDVFSDLAYKIASL